MPKVQQPGGMPGFLRREPAMQADTPPPQPVPNGNNGNHNKVAPIFEQAATGLDAINKLADERNKMCEELEFQRHRISDLEAKLSNAEYYHEYYRNMAEHYQRFSISMQAKIGTCVGVMLECQKQALADGYNQPSTTPLPDAAPPVPSPEETLKDLEDNRLRDLASQLEQPR